MQHVGMNVVARYGLVGSERVFFDPEEGWEAITEAGARFPLIHLARL